MKAHFLRIGLLGAAGWAVVLGATPPPGMILIAHAGVPTDRIGAAALKEIYLGRTTYWGDGQRVVIAVAADLNDPALQEVSGMNPSQFRTYWQRLVFSGRGQQPRKADDAAALVKLVAATKGAVALVPADAVRPGVKTIEIK